MEDRITQQDVAKLAGVSTGTVSRVINGHPMVSKEARRNVQTAIEELGYMPNTVAQSLAHGNTRHVLLVFLDKSPILPSTWQYELFILQGINDYFSSRDYSIQIGMHTLNSDNPQTLFQKIMRNKSIDGMIVLSSWTLPDVFIESVRQYKLPTVFIGNGPYSLSGEHVGTAVLFDNYRIIQEGYRLLHSLGHERIAFVAGLKDQIHARLRLEAFTEIAQKLQPDFSDNYIFQGDYSVNSGFEALYTFYKSESPPTALICANDLMAIGAMRAAKEFGLRVPKDISLIGFDNIEVSSYYSPPLASIKVPTYDLGTLGAQKLLQSITSGMSGEVVTLPTSLVVRKSIGKQQIQSVPEISDNVK